MGRITKPWLGSCIRVCRSVCGLIFWPFMEVSQLQHTRMRTPICTMEQMPLCCCLLKTSRAGCKWGDNLLSRPPLWSVFKTSEKRGDWAGSKFTHVFSVMKIRNLVEGHQFHYFTASLWAVFLVLVVLCLTWVLLQWKRMVTWESYIWANLKFWLLR